MAKILILGSGCPKCRAMEKVFKEAVEQLGVDYEVIHVNDPREFPKYGVMITPAAVVNGKVVFAGRVPGLPEAMGLLKAEF